MRPRVTLSFAVKTMKTKETKVKSKLFCLSKCLFALLIVLVCSTAAYALTPEINSVEPNYGSNNSQTEITINGSNFEATPKVALYGGGLDVIGIAEQIDGSAVYVAGNYAYVADDESGLQVIDISDPPNPTLVGSVTRNIFE